MIYPPEKIDPKKDFFEELTRYAVELVRYRAAIETDVNEHGPWQESTTKIDLGYIPPPKRLQCYDDRRAFYADYGYF